jgi:glycosyltransferase involved in cell wall biosynthesis
MTRIAVVIPHFRQAGFLAECLDSLLAQTRQPDEIILVDSSPEETGEIMARYASDVVHLVMPAAGVAAARNAGLNATTCELVAFLDVDNIAASDRIEWQLEVFESNPDIVLSHGPLVPIDRRGEGYSGIAAYASHNVPVDHQLGWLIARNRIATDTVCARRDVVMALGGFCETPGVREDYDLWLRMATQGRFHYVDAPLALYRRHETNLSNNEAYMFEWEAGALNRLDWSVIADALRRAYPDDAERAIVEGEVMLRRGELGQAEMHFIALAREPRAAAALFHLSHLALRRGSVDYAESMLRRALKEDADDAGLWNNLGVVLARSGRSDAAADAFACAVDLRPHYRDAAANLDQILHGHAGAWRVTCRRLRPQLIPMMAVAA